MGIVTCGVCHAPGHSECKGGARLNLWARQQPSPVECLQETHFSGFHFMVCSLAHALFLSRARARSPSLFLFSSTICVSGLKFKLNLLLVYVSTQAFKLALEKHKTHESCSSNWRMDTTCELPLVAMVIWPGDLLLDWLTHELCALNLNSILDLNLY